MVKSTDLENRCLTLLIWHRVEIRDEVNVFTCSLNVRFESSMIPRSLTKGTGARFLPRKGTLTSGILLNSCRIPNKISLVLLGLMSSWLVQHQAAMRRRSPVTLVRQESMSLDGTKGKPCYHRHMTRHLKIWQRRVGHSCRHWTGAALRWTPEVRHV